MNLKGSVLFLYMLSRVSRIKVKLLKCMFVKYLLGFECLNWRYVEHKDVSNICRGCIRVYQILVDYITFIKRVIVQS